MTQIEVSIVIPCLNEAVTIGRCIGKANQYLERNGIAGEVIVADNGSTDASRTLAATAGARVIDVPDKGYGAALRGGIDAAKGKYVIMGDADESYDFGNLDAFVSRLREGTALVVGNRFKGGISPGAMPFLHRYLGNPVLSFLGRLFFRIDIGDFHCGLRGFNRDAIRKIGLKSSGMEFASEMIVRAALARLSIVEVPTTLSRDGRDRAPHLRTWRDGWRHLRFLLTFSPRWLFLYPGLALFLAGVTLQGALLHGGISIGRFGLGVHTLLYSAAMSVMGVQMVWFALMAKVYGISVGLLPEDGRIEQALRSFTLERGVVAGIVLILGGITLSVRAVHDWAQTSYGALDPVEMMRTAIPSVSMMLIGMEFIVASFFLGMLQLQRPSTSAAPKADSLDPLRETGSTSG